MKIIRWLDENFERALIIIIFGFFTLVTIKEVGTRYFLNYSTDWAEEISRGLFIYMIYLAAAYSCRHRKHLNMGFLAVMLGKKAERIINLFSDALFLVLIYFVVSSGWGIVMDDFGYKTLVQSGTLMKYNFNLGILAFSVPFGWALMGFRLIQRQVLEFRGDVKQIEERSGV